MRKTCIFLIMMMASLVFLQGAFAATKTRSAISPYMQTDANSTYTFVGVTHPSLNTAATQIGLTIATIGLEGATPSTTFTISAGETYRIFVVSTNHSTVNSSTVTGDRVLFLSTTTGTSTSGQLIFTANTSDAIVPSPLRSASSPRKFANLNQLSIWGAIVIPASQTGFAMEFIGDSHDSAALWESGVHGGSGADSANNNAGKASVVGDGRGVN